MKPERIQERMNKLTGWKRQDTIHRTFTFDSLSKLLEFAQNLEAGSGGAALRVTIEGSSIAVTLTAGKKGFQKEDLDLAKTLNAAYRSRSAKS